MSLDNYNHPYQVQMNVSYQSCVVEVLGVE